MHGNISLSQDEALPGSMTCSTTQKAFLGKSLSPADPEQADKQVFKLIHFHVLSSQLVN